MSTGEGPLSPELLGGLLGPLGTPWGVVLRVQDPAEGSRHHGDAGWIPLEAFLAGLPARHAAAVVDDPDPQRHAADLVPWALGLPAAGFVLPALLLDLLPTTARTTGLASWLVHRHPDGYLDGVALPSGTWGQHGPAAGTVAERVVALVDPWLRQLCRVLPITARTAWGGVVDALTGSTLAAARAGLGACPEVVWHRQDRLLDELAARAPLPAKPRRVDVAHTGGRSIYTVRCTCCLHYRTHPAPDRDGDGYCATCPLRTDRSRLQRLTAHAEQSLEQAS
ncbi:MAG: hypothetical protein ACLFV0_08905 [Nitriliruptoraceae bacterium]